MKLYKFMGKYEFVVNALLNEGIYFADPKCFNDPYETKMIIQKNRKRVSIHDPKILNEIKIASLSEDADDYLMWSHYADGHKGFCIEYNINMKNVPLDDIAVFSDGGFKILFGKVIYRNDPLEISNLEASRDSYDFLKRFLHKFENWSYEKEIRAFAYIQPGCIISSSNYSISAVLIGESCPVDTYYNIKMLCKKINKNIDIKKARYDYKKNKMLFSNMTYEDS